jgi:hypothetical protein
MQPTEGLGLVGWAALLVVLLEAVVAVAFGFTALIYFALPLTLAVFAAMFLLMHEPAPGEH